MVGRFQWLACRVLEVILSIETVDSVVGLQSVLADSFDGIPACLDFPISLQAIERSLM